MENENYVSMWARMPFYCVSVMDKSDKRMETKSGRICEKNHNTNGIKRANCSMERNHRMKGGIYGTYINPVLKID